MEAALPTQGPVPGHEFFDLARSRLTFDVPPALTDPDLPPTRGDHDLDPAFQAIADIRPIRPAAVLIPVVDREDPTVLLTLRTTALPSHAGQIAFPGGKIDPEDETPLGTALREAEEEIGLDRVTPDFRLTVNPAEVADVFEVPLAFLMGPENHQRHSREWRGMMRTYYAMPFGERYIWGVTAGILRNLYERLYG